jgi:hypothetical protein
MFVWVVELRQPTANPLVQNTVVMHIASTEKLALTYCARNLDALVDEPLSWFFIFRDAVDHDFSFDAPIERVPNLSVDRLGHGSRQYTRPTGKESLHETWDFCVEARPTGPPATDA